MKKLLFIGHSYHQKTKSADFVVKMLENHFEITKFYIDPYIKPVEQWLDEIRGEKFDTVVCWQMMPSMDMLKKHVPFRKSIFFPMYDGIPSTTAPVWQEYAGTTIICFCRYLHEQLQKMGFDSKYIQYFPEPRKINDWGKKKSLFFWQRRREIDLALVDKLFDVSKVSHVHLHQAMDPNQNFVDYPIKQKRTTSVWFDKKEDMYTVLQKSALYMAPRLKEGIGMSFLDAMAQGRCVIAPNNPTMNEYIVNGKTGFLYDFSNPQKIEMKNIAQIQKNVAEYIENGFRQWEANKMQIIDWINAPIKKVKLKQNKHVCKYKLFGILPLFSIEEV